MPLFGRKQEPVPVQQAPVTHSRLSRSSRTPRTSNDSTGRKSGGLFSRRRSSSVSSMSSSDMETNRRSTGGLFSRNKEDASIVAARDRVIAAERAERDADLALQSARTSVRDAREHVRKLELEAEAEAKAAKIKAGQAKDLNRRAKPLGSTFKG